jgi:asparagine synthase (glutamine-hydrolysing)
MSKHIGQPNTAPHSLSTYSLFSGIHDAGFRVAVTGEGSDELFAGYERFGAALNNGNDWIPQYMDKFGPFPSDLRDKVLTKEFLNVTLDMPKRVEEFAKRIIKTTPGADRLNALQALDQWDRFPYYILRRVDHLSMAHAVEVRIPFCQPRVLDYARQLPLEHRLSNGKSKRVVYEAARGIIPDSIMDRKKQPFTLPVVAMIKPDTALFDFMSSVFDERIFRERGYFDPQTINRFMQQQATNPREDIANMLWSVMSFELWHRHVDQVNMGIKAGIHIQPDNAPEPR